MSLSKYLIIGAGLAAATGAILYFSKEAEPVKFDPKEHTLEKLLLVLDDLQLEYSSSYVYYYTILVNLKEQGQLTTEILETIHTRIESLTKSNDEDIAARHKITSDFMKLWISKYSANPKVSHVLKDIEDLQDQVLIKQ